MSVTNQNPEEATQYFDVDMEMVIKCSVLPNRGMEQRDGTL